MDLNRVIQDMVAKEVERQLANRHMASKSYVQSAVLEWGNKHLASLQAELDCLPGMKRQIGKLFALVREAQQDKQPEEPSLTFQGIADEARRQLEATQGTSVGNYLEKELRRLLGLLP